MIKQIFDVSIVTANYNNGKYLADFIHSINESTVLPKELIIINDGSTDDSLQILNDFSDLNYLKVINFEKNLGFCVALNAGIQSATGEYIMRVDPDDFITIKRIKTQVEFLETNTEIDVVGSNAIYFHSDTKKEICVSNFPMDHDSIKSKYYKGEHGVMHGTTTFRASVLKHNEYKQENFKAEDYDIFARIINNGHLFANIDEPLTKVRIHDQSIANNIEYYTIENTFKLRDQIFGTSTSVLKIRFYYWYILNYRKYLIARNRFIKPFYLSLAIMFYPSKFAKRIFN